MSGEGQRFKDAGYSQHKPLIEIDGKPIIQHVVELFNPQIDSYTFICNENEISGSKVDRYLPTTYLPLLSARENFSQFFI